MSVAVYLNRAPHNVRLHAWGRAPTGWWGCISWTARVTTADGHADILIAAWVPAATLKRPGWTGGGHADVPRVVLADDSRQWPAPRGWPSWYAGVWLDGEPALPPGMALVAGAAWRNRPKLAAGPP